MDKALQEKDKKKMWIYILITILVVVSIIFYARFIGTLGLVVKEYKVVNSIIPNNFYGLKIVHITDVHYGRITKNKELNNLVNKVNAQKPDIVIITGDLLDRDTDLTNDMITTLKEALSKINSTIGKYAIMGNHDYPHSEWEAIVTIGGFTNLNDSYELIYKDSTQPILITGISTNLKIKTDIGTKMNDVNTYLSNLPVEEVSKLYTILVLHEPDYIKEVNTKYNLILSGHSHNGQVRLPLIGALILPPGAKNYYKPYYKYNSSDLYISSGVGTSTLDLRLFNKPSINLYRLVNK